MLNLRKKSWESVVVKFTRCWRFSNRSELIDNLVVEVSVVERKECRMNIVFVKLVTIGRAMKEYSSSERGVLYHQGKLGLISHI